MFKDPAINLPSNSDNWLLIIPKKQLIKLQCPTQMKTLNLMNIYITEIIYLISCEWSQYWLRLKPRYEIRVELSVVNTVFTHGKDMWFHNLKTIKQLQHINEAYEDNNEAH